jgi:uncharacterized membrane protein (DUF4010 family)
MPFDIPDVVLRLGVALAIGLLLGLERGWHERDLAEGKRIAGFRTFGLIALFGGLAATLSAEIGYFVVVAGLVSVAIAFGIAQWHELKRDPDIGITTNVAALVAFGLGALAGTGRMFAAVSAAVVVALLLGVKPEMHHLLQRIERRELLATLRLLLISVVVLPILPDRTFDPWDALNPYQLWWMVVLVAGISYVGYFATRLIGERKGILATAVLGGLASSTATVLSLSRRARDRPENSGLFVSGMLAATATMFPRTLLIAAVVAPPLLPFLAAPLLSAAVTAAIAAALSARVAGKAKPSQSAETTHANPLDLKTALQFTLVLVPVMVLARVLKEWVGEAGLFALAAISGLVDIDAVTLSLATMVTDADTTVVVAGMSIIVASVINTLVKPVIAFAVAGRAVGGRLLLTLIAVLAVLIGVGAAIR